jgi:hypothetical protein
MGNNTEKSAILTGVVTGDIDLITRLNRYLAESEGASSEINWRTSATESYNFYAGKQDTAEVEEKLAEQNRPASKYNTILPKINMLCGLAAQSNRAPALFPVGVEDQPLAQLLNVSFKHIRNKCKMTDKENECFEHSVKSGRSYLGFYISGENPFKPEIKCKRIPGRDCHPDPRSTELDMSDARYFAVDAWFDADSIVERFAGFDPIRVKEEQEQKNRQTAGFFNKLTNLITHLDTSGTTSPEPSYYSSVTGMYRVVEMWWRKLEKVLWFINPLTQTEEFLSPEEFKTFVNRLSEGIETEDRVIKYTDEINTVVKYRKRVYYCLFSGTQILEQGESPFMSESFPYIQFGAYKDEDENKWFSVIEMMKDPQRGRNAVRRQLMHLLNTSTKNILVHEVGAINNEDEYKEHSSEPNFRLLINPGKFEKWRFTEQPSISPMYENLDAEFEQSMKDSSGIQDSLLGIQTSSREPGITVRMRQETGMAVLYILFNNYKRSRIQAAEFLLKAMQQYITYPMMVRDSGQEGMALMQINSEMNRQSPDFNTIKDIEADIEIAEVLDSTTMRMVVAQMLIEYSQNNPGVIPPDVILEYSDLPYTVQQKVIAYQQAMIAREDAKFKEEQELKREEMRLKYAVEKEKIDKEGKEKDNG